MILNTSTPREDIFKFIKKNPGTHLRKIKFNLSYSMGTIQYNLKILEKERKITSKRNGFYKNFYLVEINEINNSLMCALNLESQRKIILYLIKNEPCNNTELSRGIGLSSSTISWHMKKLVNSKIIDLSYDGKYSIYSLRNKKEVISFLNTYSDSTWNNMISNMTEMFVAFQE